MSKARSMIDQYIGEGMKNMTNQVLDTVALAVDNMELVCTDLGTASRLSGTYSGKQVVAAKQQADALYKSLASLLSDLRVSADRQELARSLGRF